MSACIYMYCICRQNLLVSLSIASQRDQFLPTIIRSGLKIEQLLYVVAGLP